MSTYSLYESNLKLSVSIPLNSLIGYLSTWINPQRRGSLEPSPRGPFGLSALFRFKLLLDFFGFPLGTRATYCVVGGWWVVGGAYF